MKEVKFNNTTFLNIKATGAASVPIGNQSVLNGRSVKTIITRTDPVGNLKSSNGVPISEKQHNIFLNLYNAQNVRIHEAIPLYLLDPQLNGLQGFISFDTKEIDWTKCTLTYASGADAGLDVGNEIPLLVIFD